MITKLVGYSFRPTQVRPQGNVELRLEDNKYDSMAVAVYYQDTHIGYLKKGSDEQAHVYAQLIAGTIPKATVLEYKFAYKDGDKMVFNDEHKGDLMHVAIEIDGHIGYTKDGEEYISISNLLSYLSPTGSIDSLIRWATQFSYEEYQETLAKTASEGTILHDEIDKYLNGLGEGFPSIINFKERFKPEVISTEKKVFSDYGVAGKYDALLNIDGTTVLVDWKSSKKPQLKHKIQASFYADLLGAKEAWIVTFGGTTKQGYSVCKVSQIEQYVQVIKHLASIYKILKNVKDN